MRDISLMEHGILMSFFVCLELRQNNNIPSTSSFNLLLLLYNKPLTKQTYYWFITP
jgi:hypothetical protein